MRTFLIIYLTVFSFQLVAQQNTLTGVIRDQKDKPVKNQEVQLGRNSTLKVKTNSKGFFSISDANLNDTLFFTVKKTGADFHVPVNGYAYLSLQIQNEYLNTDYQIEPDAYLNRLIDFNEKKMYSSGLITKDQIRKMGCTSIVCVLRRMNGVNVDSRGEISMRGGALSLHSSSGVLFVIDGTRTTDPSMLRSIPITDVEEIRVLKDGSEHGLEGANGVIFIKTMK